MSDSTVSRKSEIIDIISETFMTNPSVNVVIGNKGNRKKKIRRLAEYSLEKALNRNGAYLSDNKMGAALCFKSNAKGSALKEFWYELRLAVTLPMSKIINTLKRESYIKKHRAKDPVYYYFWFLGVKKGGGKAGFELKDIIFQKAQEENLPIFLETSVDRNVLVYERYGFETYHTWYDEANDVSLRFMRWAPSTN